MSYDYTAPWTVPPYIGVGWDVVDANGVNVAQYIQEEECARLIAAAPDLYNFLWLALSYMYDYRETSTNMAFKHMLTRDIQRIEDLLRRIDLSQETTSSDKQKGDEA